MQRPSASASQFPQQTTAYVTLRCLGDAEVVLGRAGEPPKTVLGLGKPLALLAYLALSPNRSFSRETLADLLWGDRERSSGRHALRNALLYLRSNIGEWIVDADDRRCTVSPTLRTDVFEFIQAIDRGDLAAALALYRGDFLADFSSPGCQQFEQWADVERSYLRSKALTAGELICRQALDSGRFADARIAATRLKEIDPESQLGWRLTLEALGSAGDHAEAAAEAARFETWLESDGRELEPASRAALRAAQRAPETILWPAASQSLVAEFVGRESAFTIVLDSWKQAREGRTKLVVVSASAGLGKTRLLNAATNRLRSQRQRVVLVRAYPGEQPNPFAFASALVHELARLPGAAGVPSTLASYLVALDSQLAEQFRASSAHTSDPNFITQCATALRELLASVCDEAPLALLIDDSHWIDTTSRQIVAGACARLDGVPLVIVVTTRSDVTGLSIDERAIRIELPPLRVADVHALIASVGALPKDEDWTSFLVARITAASRGIPLLVLGTLEQLLADETLILRDGEWAAPGKARIRERLRHIDPLAARLRALSPPAFRLLLASSLAGVPLPREVIVALSAGEDSASQHVAEELERLGYLRNRDSLTEVGHDAFAECAIAIATDAEREQASRLLGRQLVALADDHHVERGVRLLLDASTPALAHRALARLVSERRPHSRKAVRAELARITGAPVDDPRVNDAFASLPLSQRYPARRRGLIAAAFLVVAATAAAVEFRNRPALPPDAVLEIVIRPDRSHAQDGMVWLHNETWASADLSPHWMRAGFDTLARPVSGAVVEPFRDQWAVERQFLDSGAADVALVGPRGVEARLTRSRADEIPGSWSPDGRFLAIETSQFGLAGHRVIGILTLSDKSVRPLAPSSGFDSAPRWSPDGTRVAFVHDPRDGTRRILCMTTLDNADLRCSAPPDDIFTLLGWTDADHLVGRVGLDGSLYEISTEDLAFRRTPFKFNVGIVDLSPDGRWLVYQQIMSNVSEVHVAFMADLLHPRTIPIPATTGDITYNWRGTSRVREYLDTLKIESKADTIPMGVAFALRAPGLSNLGNAVGVRALRWRSLTPSIGAVDSTGTVRAQQPGTLIVEATAGGWRSTKRTFHVVAEPTVEVFSERWTEPLESRWRLYGDQRPMITHDSLLGNAFWNNGSGNYFSGAYLIAPVFDARDGLALDAIIRMPLTRYQWQYLQVGFERIPDVDALQKGWDHRTGYLPYRFLAPGSCAFAYPDEGPKGAFSAYGYEFPRPLGDTLPPLATGVPTNIRIQIMPDGRCGIAVNGKPVFIGPALGRLDLFHVFTQGSSVATRILLGPISVRRGVPTDIDWNALPALRPR